MGTGGGISSGALTGGGGGGGTRGRCLDLRERRTSPLDNGVIGPGSGVTGVNGESNPPLGEDGGGVCIPDGFSSVVLSSVI